MWNNFLYDKNISISKNVMTEHLEQIAVKYVVTVIKGSHVTRRRGYVPQCVTQDTMGSTATNVRYQIVIIYWSSHLEILINECILLRYTNILQKIGWFCMRKLN